MSVRKNAQFVTPNAYNSGLNLLFLSSFPMLLWFFDGGFAGIATAVLTMILFLMSLRLVALGIEAHAEYDRNPAALRPSSPRKLMGSMLIGVMVLILAGHQFVSLHVPLALGISATMLSILAFGLDPMKDKASPEDLQRQAANTFPKQARVAMKKISVRVGDLEDSDLSTRTDAALGLVSSAIQMSSTEMCASQRVQKPAKKFISILSNELDKLEAAWDGDNYQFERQKFIAKLQVMSESFAENHQKTSAKEGRDQFDHKAGLLLARMKQEKAA